MIASAIARRVRTALLDLDPSAARLDVRGFAATTSAKRERLEASGGTFIAGYRAAIRTGHPHETADACEEIPILLRGFAYEGAAMGFSLLDLLTRGTPRRFSRFLDASGDRHAYMVHVGAGWAIARCSWGVRTFLPMLDPLFSPLTIDGIGFHDGFFYPAAAYERQRPRLLRRCDAEAFDTGLGRALWFVSGAQPTLAIDTIMRFPPARRPALWSGLGLAATYAGGATDEDLLELAAASGDCRPHIAQGAAFAAKARERAGNASDDSDRACRVFCQLAATEAAALTDRCFEEVAGGPDAFPRWRRRLIEVFAASGSPSLGLAGAPAPDRSTTHTPCA